MKLKQAVVFIHGIGEQKPMDNLRAFVGAVLPPAKAGHEQYFNKPDPIAELFELRRLQAAGRTKTHFYEYYWAHHVEGTTLLHLGQWLIGLIRRPRVDVPEPLQGLWVSSRVIIALLCLAVVVGLGSQAWGWFDAQPKFGRLWSVATIALAALQYGLIHYAGDAARYLSPHPANVVLRQKIRAEGLKLLRELQDSRQYDRIIVVGHSLGSVIGYDLITRLWQETHGQFSGFDEGNQALQGMLHTAQPTQPVVRDELPADGQDLKLDDPDSLGRFRGTQHRAWLEQAWWGNPWRISDFITLGSPLAHAMLLLANSRDEFATRQRQRELPTCPPQPDEVGYAYPSAQSHEVLGKAFVPLILHHAAPFAVTRWTNLYVPVKWGLRGDLIAGPLRPVFGLGIQDVPVQVPPGSRRKGLFRAHTSYWDKGRMTSPAAADQAPMRADTGGDRVLPQALQALVQALGLTYLRGHQPRPPRARTAEPAATPQPAPQTPDRLSDSTPEPERAP